MDFSYCTMFNMLASFVRQTPFGIAVFLILFAVFAAVIAFPVNRQLIVIKSDSMAPLITSGDLVVFSNKNVFSKGDIVAFKDSKKTGSIVARRVVEVVTKNSKVYLKTQGEDAAADEFLVPQSSVLGKASYSVKGFMQIFGYWPIAIASLWFMATVYAIRKVLRGFQVKKTYGRPMGLAYSSVSFQNLLELLISKLTGAKNSIETQFSFSSEGVRFGNKLNRA